MVVGSGGEGVQVATIKADPTIDESQRIIYNTHTKRLFIRVRAAQPYNLPLLRT